jgi:hypothetical protein
MKSGRTEESTLPKWKDLQCIPLTNWIQHGKYEKAYFKMTPPSITTSVATQVKIRQDGSRFAYIIQMNEELQEFVEFINRNIYFSPLTYKLDESYHIKLSVYDNKFYIKSFVTPIIFDEDKKHIPPNLPLNITAKVKISAHCILKQKDENAYNIFFNVDQILFDECAWK